MFAAVGTFHVCYCTDYHSWDCDKGGSFGHFAARVVVPARKTERAKQCWISCTFRAS